MLNKVPVVRIDETGVMRVGAAGVSLDEIVASQSKGGSIDAILARFPSLTREELQAALDFHAAEGPDVVPRRPEQRDAHWRRWNATIKEDLGTDTPPNEPIAGRAED